MNELSPGASVYTDMKRFLPPVLLLGLAASLAPATAQPGTNLNLRAEPEPVVFGRTVALTGRLTGKNKDGKTVQVQADPFPYEGNFNTIASPVTGNNGAFSAAHRPAVNTRYRARQGSTFSAVLTERVRIRVSIRVSDRTPAAGRRVRFRGRACPQHDGARVRIQRRTRTGRWRTVRRTRLRDIPGSTCSSYSRRFRIFRDGTYRAWVVSPHGDHASGRSRSRRIDVH
jgi:hypothetical protein